MCKLLVLKALDICNRLFCCKPKHTYQYVRYDDDTVVHNNILYDMRNINFGVDSNADRQWRTCDLYEG
jgi:hypothetical protein